MSENSIQVDEVQWSQLAVIICSKCQTLFEPGQLQMAGSVADQLKNTYKARLKQDGLSEKCRVMVSGCQNICLNNRQAVTFLPNDTSKMPVTTVTVHPDQDVEPLYQMIKKSCS